MSKDIANKLSRRTKDYGKILIMLSGEEIVAASPPPLPAPAFPGFWGAAGLTALYFVFQSLCVIPFVVIDLIWKTQLVRNTGILAIVVLAAGACTITFAVGHWRIPLSEVIGHGKVPFAVLPWVFCCCFGNLLLVATIAATFIRLVPGAEKWSNRLRDLLHPGDAPLATFLLLVVIAPLIEESIFRGVLLNGLLLRYSRPGAIAISAALFAVAHGNPLQIFAVVGFGSLLGWWYSETKSIWLGVMGHAMNNGLAFLALMSTSGKAIKNPAAPPVSAILVMLALGAIFLLGGIQGCKKGFLQLKEPLAL